MYNNGISKTEEEVVNMIKLGSVYLHAKNKTDTVGLNYKKKKRLIKH